MHGSVRRDHTIRRGECLLRSFVSLWHLGCPPVPRNCRKLQWDVSAGRAARAARRLPAGAATPPLFQLKSAQPMSSARIIRKEGRLLRLAAVGDVDINTNTKAMAATCN